MTTHLLAAVLLHAIVPLATPLPTATPSAQGSSFALGCRIAGEFTPADSVHAYEACALAQSRFVELFGAAAPSVTIDLHARAGYRVGADNGHAVVRWPNSAGLAARPDVGAAADRAAAQWREVLPHETMHGLLAAFVYGADAATAHDQYGTPLPDWFEEAVGIWGEPPASRHARIAQARALPARFRDLSVILTGSHPAVADRTLLAARDGAALPASAAALWAFYPQSIAVLAFVHDAGGSAAVRALAERLRAEPGRRRVLEGLPGLPADTELLLRQWQAWLERGDDATGGG